MFSLYLYYLRMWLQGRGVGSVKPGGGVGGGVIQEGHLFDIMAHKGGHLFGRGHLLECELKM